MHQKQSQEKISRKNKKREREIERERERDRERRKDDIKKIRVVSCTGWSKSRSDLITES